MGGHREWKARHDERGRGGEPGIHRGAAARKGTEGKFPKPARVSRQRHLEGEEPGNSQRREARLRTDGEGSDRAGCGAGGSRVMTCQGGAERGPGAAGGFEMA